MLEKQFEIIECNDNEEILCLFCATPAVAKCPHCASGLCEYHFLGSLPEKINFDMDDWKQNYLLASNILVKIQVLLDEVDEIVAKNDEKNLDFITNQKELDKLVVKDLAKKVGLKTESYYSEELLEIRKIMKQLVIISRSFSYLGEENKQEK